MPKAKGAPVVLHHGEERFLVEQKGRALVEEWRRELVPDFGFDPIDAAGLTAGRLQDAVLQAPFLDPYRVVWVKGVVAAKADSLAPALEAVPETTRLVIAVVGRLGPGSKLVKAVNAAGGRAEESQRLKGRVLTDWVVRRGRGGGVGPGHRGPVGRRTPPGGGVPEAGAQKSQAPTA